MPRKTKQDKILARLRRLQGSQTDPVEAEPQKQTISLDLDSLKNEKVAEIAPTKGSVQDYSYVIADLRKTLFFVVVAVLFEIALSLFLKSWL